MAARETVVESIKAETPDVKTYTLRMSDKPGDFEFKAGQFVMIEVACIKDGRRVILKRAYSIASEPSQKRAIRLTIKKQGIVTSELDTYKGGEKLKLTGPYGEFTHKRGMSDNIMGISAGVGIAPVLAIAKDILTRNPRPRITILCSIKTPGDLIYREDLTELSKKHPELKILHTITRPQESREEELAGWTGMTGRIDRGMLKRIIDERRPEHFFVCGWPEMVRDCKKHLNDLGFSDDMISAERY